VDTNLGIRKVHGLLANSDGHRGDTVMVVQNDLRPTTNAGSHLTHVHLSA
jgi:hypothetical protein